MTVGLLCTPPKAKVGDLLIVHTFHRSLGADLRFEERHEFTVGRITETSLTGRARQWRTVASEFMPIPRELEGIWVLPSGSVDVLGVLRAAARHTEPGSDTPKPYRTASEAAAAIRPHLTDPLAGLLGDANKTAEWGVAS